MYREILDSIYKMMCAGMDDYEYVDGTNGIGEIIMSGEENILEQVALSEEMTEEAYWAKSAAYSANVKTLTFYPFSTYEYNGK